jgi:hypothetical protein
MGSATSVPYIKQALSYRRPAALSDRWPAAAWRELMNIPEDFPKTLVYLAVFFWQLSCKLESFLFLTTLITICCSVPHLV